MGRKPNYRADRIERERAKATKKAKRLEAKTGKTDKQGADDTPVSEGASDVPETADGEERADGDEQGEPDAS
jgi:hypothetical protein